RFSLALPVVGTARFFRLQAPPLSSIDSTSPVDGETGVAVTCETIVRFSGPLAANASVTATNFYAIRTGLILNGVLRIDHNAAVVFEGTQTLATGTVEFAGDSGILGLSGVASLTLGPNVVVHSKSGNIGQRVFFGGPQSLINQGLISADVPGGTLTINPTHG